MDTTTSTDPTQNDQQQVSAGQAGTVPGTDSQNQQAAQANEQPSLMGGEQKAEANEKAEQQNEEPQGAPESYEAFNAPDGIEIDDGMQQALASVGKESNLTQAQMQGLVDKLAPEVKRQQLAKLEAVSSQWIEQTKADPEFGGKNLDENLSFAKKAYEKYFDAEQRKIFRELRLENNLALLKPLAAIGRDLIAEDRPVAAVGGNGAGPDARAFYPNSSMNK